MAKNTSVSLGNHFDDFIIRQVTDGRYGSASEVIRAGLRKLEDEDEKLKTLRALIQEGIASGTAEYSYDSLMKELDEGT